MPTPVPQAQAGGATEQGSPQPTPGVNAKTPVAEPQAPEAVHIGHNVPVQVPLQPSEPQGIG